MEQVQPTTNMTLEASKSSSSATIQPVTEEVAQEVFKKLSDIMIPQNKPSCAQSTMELSVSTCITEKIKTSTTISVPKITPSIGFAIDIDGVLLKCTAETWNKPLLGARMCIKKLQDHNIPFVILTNRKYESTQDALEDLNLPFPGLLPNQIIHRLTPFKELLPHFKSRPVLVMGQIEDDNRKLGEELGFTDVYTAEDFYLAFPTLAPKLFPATLFTDSRSKAENLLASLHTKGPAVEISAILVLDSHVKDLRYIDDEDISPNKLLIQILKPDSGDLRIESPFNGKKSLPNNGYQQSSAPQIYYETCNPPHRIFRTALEHAWKAETGQDLLYQINIGGKPAAPMFAYAEKILNERQRELHGEDVKKLKKIVMIGDTPDADIRGVNRYNKRPGQGKLWSSVLLQSGVWNPENHGWPMGDDRPDAVAANVMDAVVALSKSAGIDLGVKHYSEYQDEGEEDNMEGENDENYGDSEYCEETEAEIAGLQRTSRKRRITKTRKNARKTRLTKEIRTTSKVAKMTRTRTIRR